MNKKYQVFISSTFKDLIEERQEAMRAVLDLRQIPSGMEIFPAADVEQFEYIKKVVDECDYYVLIIGARYGSTDRAGVSFTEKEYDYAVEQKKTVLAFIHSEPSLIPVGKVDVDPTFAAKLTTFREKVSNGRLVKSWNSPHDLKHKVTVALTSAFKDAPGIGWIRGNAVPHTATNIRPSAPDPMPDMTILELFLHINPFVLDRTQSDDAPWETVGLAIRDKLSLKHLHIWGRQVLEGMSKTYGKPVLQEIEPSYWQSTDFTYTFFHSDAGNAPHVYIKDATNLPCYTELQVNRAQVEAIWPKPNLRLLLARLRREGVAIRNDSCRLELEDADFNAWSLEGDKWRERTAYVIEQIDAADAEWFRILDIVPEPREPLLMPRKKHEGKHFAAHRQHDFRLAKLEQLIQRYSARGAVAVYA
jgi:hypothetical protein